MQPQPNQFLNFLVELVSRLRTKKPKFFVYLQYLTGFMGAVTGLPALLIQWGVTLPPAATVLENKFVAACSAGFFIASQLTTANPIAAVTKDGAVLKQTDAVVMPFTAQHEVVAAQKAEIPNTTTTLAEVKTTPLQSK
jgi:hypothetical protein